MILSLLVFPGLNLPTSRSNFCAAVIESSCDSRSFRFFSLMVELVWAVLDSRGVLCMGSVPGAGARTGAVEVCADA